jgi:UDP-2-acetamido-3-amino-2,3-dideoxy-glucuronate N-acetyltransferase
MSDPFIHESVNLDGTQEIGENSRIWSNSQLGSNARIGSGTTIGRNVYIGPGAIIGNNCKIQNNALIYEPAKIEDGVFIGPGVILTNDKYPRAVNTDGTIKSSSDWNPVGVHVMTGASIGAGVVCIAPLIIGEWALISAGAVVVDSVKPFSLMVGTPARKIGWVGTSGVPLESLGESRFKCPSTGHLYFEDSSGNLIEKN